MRLPILAFAALALLLGSCTKPPPPPAAVPAKHEHKPPHGGTAVVLGTEIYHLELVRDAAAGKVQAYVLDGELENFIRIAQPEIIIQVTEPASAGRLVLHAVGSPATGETVGDTSLFEGQADWLKTTGTFDGSVQQVTIKGTAFSAVTFNFPHGNDRD
jgi:hypothetical protein